MPAALLALGAVLVIAGAAWLSVPWALIAAGLMAIVAAVDLRPGGRA